MHKTDATTKPAPSPLPPPIKAGQVYRAKATHGWRYVLVEQVRGLKGYNPYTVLREVSQEGNPLRGWRDGVDRSAAFYSQLRLCADEHYRLSPSYELITKEG